jgi:DNA repair exonuclease SbcCD nuclease subunit
VNIAASHRAVLSSSRIKEGYAPMPLHLDSPLNRRRFLQLVLASTGTLTAIQLTPTFAADAASCHMAFFSDTHIKPFDPQEKTFRGHFYYSQHAHIQRSVREALAAKPDGVIITGDLARSTGELDDYRQLAKFLKPLEKKVPIYYAMGNHDDRDHFASVFTGLTPKPQPVPKKHVLVLDQGPVRFILLDSCMEINKGPGLLGEEQLAWLDRFLKESDDKPTLLCFHHYPDKNPDNKRFPDWPKLLEVIRPLETISYILSHAGSPPPHQAPDADPPRPSAW